MKNKKAMELSINFIVILIISITIFAGGLAIFGKFFKMAEDRHAEITAQTQKQIEDLLSDGDSIVVIPINEKTIRRSEQATFALGIVNNLGVTKDFYVQVNFSTAVGDNNQVITDAEKSFIEKNWLLYTDTHRLENNEYLAIPILVGVEGAMSGDLMPSTPTEDGTYVFNVYVCAEGYGGGGPDHCDALSSRDELYDDRVHKIRVKVP